MDRKARAATESGVLLLIIAGVLVALNALGALGQYKRFDTTKAERFTLSKGSGKLLSGMKGSMHVDAYVTKGLPKLDAFTRDLRDLLQEYKDNSGGKFDYTMIEAKDDTQKEAAKKAGLVEQPFGEASATEEKAAVTQGFMGLVFKYGAEQDVIKFLPPDRTDGLEFWITNKVREIVDRADDVKHKIGVLTGNDEMKLTEANLVPTSMGKPSMQEIITRNFPFYALSDVDLKGGDSEIPDDLDGLIITQPDKDLTEKELRRIDQFVMKGKSVAIFAGAVNMKAGDATMNATMNLHGLDKLLAGYGIEVKKDVILDFGRSFTAIMPT
ncbi:MAG: GldG family protein, partial [Polyangiaceae bacterium]